MDDAAGRHLCAAFVVNSPGFRFLGVDTAGLIMCSIMADAARRGAGAATGIVGGSQNLPVMTLLTWSAKCGLRLLKRPRLTHTMQQLLLAAPNWGYVGRKRTPHNRWIHDLPAGTLPLLALRTQPQHAGIVNCPPMILVTVDFLLQFHIYWGRMLTTEDYTIGRRILRARLIRLTHTMQQLLLVAPNWGFVGRKETFRLRISQWTYHDRCDVGSVPMEK